MNSNAAAKAVIILAGTYARLVDGAQAALFGPGPWNPTLWDKATEAVQHAAAHTLHGIFIAAAAAPPSS